jgi:hypothetical protein
MTKNPHDSVVHPHVAGMWFPRCTAIQSFVTT